MRRWLLTLLLSIPVVAMCQQQEFDLYAGLLYTANDMQVLKKTADSLNLKYLQCVPNPQYHAWPQTEAQGYSFVVKEKQLPQLEAQLKKNASLNELVQRIPGLVVEDTAHYVLAYYVNSNPKKDITLFYGDGSGFDNEVLSAIPGKGNWVYVAQGTDEKDSTVDVKAFLLDRPFATLPVPQDCAKMIQYVDCMVDTSTAVMLAEKYGSEYANKPFQRLIEYVRQRKHPEKDSASYSFQDDEAKKFIVDEYPKNKRVHQLLDDAITDALKNGNGGEMLEGVAGRVFSQDTVLLLMRSRQVMGFCSMDDSPRRHARDIAVMSSRLHQWPVFIRAHLDIMNDHFSRMSDGSYAQAGRSTYLRELELLNIPVQQLLLGTIFRVNDVPVKHYYGSLSRIGRAFTESAYTEDFEKQVKGFMADKRLDPFNQCMFSMLYISYINWQAEGAARQAKMDAWKAEAAAFPIHIQKGINAIK